MEKLLEKCLVGDDEGVLRVGDKDAESVLGVGNSTADPNVYEGVLQLGGVLDDATVVLHIGVLSSVKSEKP